MRDGLLQWVGLRYHFIQLSCEVQQKALSEINGAFNQLPVGTAKAALAEVIDSVIDRHHGIHEQQRRDKKEATRREAEQQGKRRDAEFKADLYLSHIEKYLQQEFEFDSYFEMHQEATRLREPIRVALVEELTEDPDLDADHLHDLIEACIDGDL